MEDSQSAGHDAAAAALRDLGRDKAALALVVASPRYDQALMLKGIHAALGDTPVVGCTSAGAIVNEGVLEKAVSILLVASDAGTFTPIKVTGIGKDMRSAGRQFGEQVKAAGDAKVAFMFSDALAGNGTELVRGVLDVMGSGFPLVGGAAGDDMDFKKTSQYFNEEVLGDAAVGFAIAGDVRVVAGADHGWEPIGTPRKVTKAEGTKLIELDGKPAFEIYKDYFAERADDFKKALSLAAVSYPLGMKAPGHEQLMIRVPLVVGDDGSIVCGAEVLEGSEVSILLGTMASALGAAEDIAKKLAAQIPDIEKRVVFVSDCVARKILLGEHGSEEIALLRAIGGPKAQIFGFYSYGQMAPLRTPAADVNTCDPGYYEQSISITMFGV